jgi:hypothetical protein
VSGVDAEPGRERCRGGRGECPEWRRILRRVRVASGVQFDGMGTQRGGAVYRLQVGIDEERGADPGASQGRDGAREFGNATRDIQAAFRGDFGSLFWYDRHLMGAVTECDGQHFIGAGHFEVERGRDGADQCVEVGVADVAAIFSQVHGDAVAAGVLTPAGRHNRIGMLAAAGIPERGDVVDVDEKTLVHWWCGPQERLLGLPTMLNRMRTMSALRVMLVLVTLAVAGCRTGGSRGPDASVGADGPRQAAERFLASVRNGDVQATSIIWGSSKGPARLLIQDRNELEKRILIMHCNMAHTSYRILSELPDNGEKRIVRLELTKGQLKATTTMTVTPGPAQRWFVEESDLRPLRGFCTDLPNQGR